MQSCKSIEAAASPGFPRAQWLAGSLLSACLAALAAPSAQATSFEVEHVQTRLVDGVYVLNADIGMGLSTESLEALESGVPLTVVLDMDIVQERKVVWNKQVASLSARNELRIHALSRKYVVRNLNSDASRSYNTLDSAVEAMGTLEDFPMLDSHLLQRGEKYRVKIRARLDIEALPSPLRPVAYLSSLWQQSSEWSTWPLEH